MQQIPSVRYILFFLCISLGVSVATGQKPQHVPGQFLVSLHPGDTPQLLLSRTGASRPSTNLRVVRQVARLLNVWLLETRGDEREDTRVLGWLRQQPEIQMAQFNHKVEERSFPPDILPDDPLFDQQWQHLNSGAGGGVPNADLDSDMAWNITTGGVTPQGDTIVVAVVDGGIQSSHPDLTGNMWHNYQESPGDSIDNDGNGYVDDYMGWNVYTHNDNIAGSATGHGTPVSAIVGAKGNNGIGVAGVNWNVKIMFVVGNTDEAAILESYDYVWNARKRYNATNGQQGAFVVAVNSSWGITYGQPAEAPLWCAAFDSLGKAGIISVASTANMALNIDEVGDLPTACPSDFLISVTSLTKTDQKASNAAWGLQTIDLGAYGKDVFTAGPGSTYGVFSGTSFAAPQVSGAIGLLYSAPCSNLTGMTKANPAAAALWVKGLVLSSTTPNAELYGKTLTGGRLNLNNLLQDYEDQCADCPAPFAINVEEPAETQATLHWSVVADVQSVNIRWRKIGDPTWMLVSAVQSPFTLNGLAPCTDYEFVLRGNCGGAAISSWSPAVIFRTDGCCSPPSSFALTGVTPVSVSITWNNLSASTAYKVRIRPVGGATWQEYVVPENGIDLNGLSICTQYELSTQTLCGNDNSAFSDPYLFRTGGCGACTELDYCVAGSDFALDEWISGIEIGAWSNFSGGTTGYQDFTASSLTNKLVLLPGVPLPVTLTPAYSGLPYKEYFRIYIDYNADGDFTDPDELAFDPGFASDEQVIGQIIPPNSTASGFTRMRVMMKYTGPQNIPPAPCESFEFGQVEDYCAHLGVMTGSGEIPNELSALLIFPQPGSEQVNIARPGRLTGPVHLMVYDAAGRLILSEHNTREYGVLTIHAGTWPEGFYVVCLEEGGQVYRQKMLIAR